MEFFKSNRKELPPVHHTETHVDYLGVKLEKATNTEKAIPKEAYANFVEDDFSMALEQKIATAWAQGQPILIEGGTSIGKTTTVKKMCADLGWEPHYINLTSSADPETLMERALPNKEKKSSDDQEYVYLDGVISKGLRQEEGKIKVIILDEYNSASPGTLIRLHEILDALERDGVVNLEMTGDQILVNKQKTKIIALTNPPGKGYLERQPLDPAQLRRWVYHKEATSLPQESFEKSLNVWAGFEESQNTETQLSFTENRTDSLLKEQVSEIPGLQQIFKKYTEFHFAAIKLLETRQIGIDQPQKFIFSDRDESARVLSYIKHFYNGDITETTQNALRYYYVGKVLDPKDKQKLEELIVHVKYVEPKNTARVGLEDIVPVENTTTTSPETSSVSSEQLQEKLDHLSADLKSAWSFSVEMSPILKNPIDLDWNEFIKKSQEKTMTPGAFTLNPETLNLDFDKITPVVINKPRWLGKKRGEVFAEVIQEYSATHYIPGYEYIEWLNKHPDKHHDILDKTNYFYAPATVIGSDGGYGRVPCARWLGDRWYRIVNYVENAWGTNDRVLLLPR